MTRSLASARKTTSSPAGSRRLRPALTSAPRPPLEISVSDSTRSGYWYWNCSETPPPSSADHVNSVDAEMVEQVADAGGVGTEAEVAVAVTGFAVAEQVDGDHGATGVQAAPGTSDQVLVEDPTPWTRSNGVPVPWWNS